MIPDADADAEDGDDTAGAGPGVAALVGRFEACVELLVFGCRAFMSMGGFLLKEAEEDLQVLEVSRSHSVTRTFIVCLQKRK